MAVESNSTERVQLFIEAGARLTHTLPDGVNVIHRAVQLFCLNIHDVTSIPILNTFVTMTSK